MEYLKEILYLLEEDKWKLPLMTFFFLIMSILEVLGISLIAPYAALIINPDILVEKYSFLEKFGLPIYSDSILLIMSLLLISLFIIKTIGLSLINWLIFSFCYDRQIKMRSKLMKSYQSMPYVEYTQRNSSEYIYNMSAVGTFTQGVLISLLRIVTEVIVGLFIFIFLVFQDPVVLFVLIILLGGFIFLYDFIFRKRIKRYGNLVNVYTTEMLKKINESVHGLKEVRILGNEKYFYNQVMNNATGLSNTMRMKDFISSVPRYFLELIMILFIVVIVVLYSYQGKELELVVPILTMFSIAAIRLFPSVNQIVGGITHIRFGRPIVALLCKDLKAADRYNFDQKINIKDEVSAFESIELRDVSYAYPSRKLKVIDGLSIKIKKGDSVGIIGPSGSGKTTLLDILLGLIEVDIGSVLFNGKDLNKYDHEWKSHVAYIPQNIFIIDNTIARNIALGEPDDLIDHTRLDNSINQSKLAELINQMPEGVNTLLGEDGIQLSGGQRQRIALARAFYHNRDILVMDEATSALDNETELEIVNEIKLLKGNKTLIVIAHRLSTVKHCDYIYRIDKGKIVDKGNYKTVIGEG
ncbi:MAG: ABC transporter ATP-binding protein [Candidatus Marinimicrobia bacterium]|nr:ABC transporter ATP-binding protein [Candidatus Neomarinimicrobiota bacterium]